MIDLDRRYTTVVFEFDIRDYDGNPLKAVTPFGKPIAIGIGDAFAEQDAPPQPNKE